MLRIRPARQHIHSICIVFALWLLVSACAPTADRLWSLFSATPPPPAQPVSQTLHAEILFRVQIPLNTPENATIFIELLDEVTGLGLNPSRYPLTAESANYHSIQLPFQVGSVVKYRYLVGATPLLYENTPADRLVRYRLFPVTGPGMIQDSVATWSGLPFTGETGRIFGTITDQSNGLPVPDVLITSAGLQTVSTADGTFWLDGVPQGTHHLTAFSIDGSYRVYEQGARVAPGAATQANMKLIPVPFVNVTFMVNTPGQPVDNAQMRMIGNLYSLGNTFADLGGGINTLASRAPEMSKQEDGKYRIDLRLPVGFDLRYKYSLGDGFWNAEHSAGKFRVRQLIIPTHDVVVEDTVETWSSGDAAPVVFIVRTPANMPETDEIYIQFNPFAWLEPLPMWRSGVHEWVYILSSPLELLGKVQYRYCRNGFCPQSDVESDILPGGEFEVGSEIQYFQDHIGNWPYLPNDQGAAVVPSKDIRVREGSFIAGIEYSQAYHPNWSSQQLEGLKRVQMLNGNLLVITPAWTLTQQNPPVITPIPGRDGLWADWLTFANHAKEADLPLAIYPQLARNIDIDEWWMTAERDLSWWLSWYDRYQTFMLHHARLASQSGAAALIIGGPEIAPAYPHGLLPDGTPSGTPDEAEGRWRDLIQEVRKVFQGQLLFAMRYDGNPIMPPPFLSEVDQIYLLWDAPVPEDVTDTYSEATQIIYDLLERDIRPLHLNFRKPVVVAFQFCSSTHPQCQAGQLGYETNPGVVDLQIQQNLYNAALSAVDDHSWIVGFISRGYFPTLMMADGSPSVNGKPAWNILWYWYPRWLAGDDSNH
ncbi:MAG: carboxypeptidase regulatory-like domain-containing protein [Anaerolineaceae bacterium]